MVPFGLDVEFDFLVLGLTNATELESSTAAMTHVIGLIAYVQTALSRSLRRFQPFAALRYARVDGRSLGFAICAGIPQSRRRTAWDLIRGSLSHPVRAAFAATLRPGQRASASARRQCEWRSAQ